MSPIFSGHAFLELMALRSILKGDVEAPIDGIDGILNVSIALRARGMVISGQDARSKSAFRLLFRSSTMLTAFSILLVTRASNFSRVSARRMPPHQSRRRNLVLEYYLERQGLHEHRFKNSADERVNCA